MIHTTPHITAKYNGEEIDSWTNFAINESIDLDSGHGPINYLVEWKNSLLFYQDDGFGSLAVLERSLIQDSAGRNLTLGEGDVLQRYDMLSTEIGCSTRQSLIVTESGIFWFAAKKKRMYKLAGNIQELSVLKGMNSYFQNINDNVISNDNIIKAPNRGFSMVENHKFNEIWFTIKNTATTGETLVYNTILDNFTLFIDNKTAFGYLVQDDVLVTQAIYGRLYKENSEAVERCSFRGEIQDVIVEVIVNPGGNLVHTLTNLELATELIDDSGNNKLDETLTSLQVSNDYQDTGVMALVPDDNIIRRLRTWRFNDLWDSGTDARLRDTYSRIRVTHTNISGSNRKIILHDLVSIFAMPIESVVNKK